MSPPNPRHHDVDEAATPGVGRTTLFKDDRPRHIDRYISFFGEETEQNGESSPRGDETRIDRWSAS